MFNVLTPFKKSSIRSAKERYLLRSNLQTLLSLYKLFILPTIPFKIVN